MYFTKGGLLSRVSIVKFGGSSVATAEKIENAARLVTDHVRKAKKVVVVISAMGKRTDELSTLTDYLAKKAKPEHVDEILAMGERTSARVLTAAIAANGVNVNFIDVEKPDWPIVTDENFGDANIILGETKKRIAELVLRRLQELDVLVLPGFIGKTMKGKITTVGRGGSDTTAFVVADALGAKKVILVSDVDAIMSADPKLISNPKRIDEIQVEKLIGLADSGVKFLHKKALGYKPKGTEVHLISNRSASLDAKGTVIKGSIADIEASVISNSVMSITIVGNNMSANPGLLAKMLNAFKKMGIGILGLTANHDSLVFYVPSAGAEKIFERLHDIVVRNKETLAIARRPDLALLRINGIGLQETPGSISRAATVLRNSGINIYGQYTVMSEIFMLVRHGDGERAMGLLQKEFSSNALGASRNAGGEKA